MKENQSKRTIEIIGVCFIIIGVGIWVYYLFALNNSGFKLSNIADPAIESNIGDFVGGIVGTIFSLVGVILFYSALTLQRKELKETNDAFKEQAKIMNRDLFETTLFNFLQSFDQIKMTFTKESKGYKELSDALKLLRSHYNWFNNYSGLDRLKNEVYSAGAGAEVKFRRMFEQILLVQTGGVPNPQVHIKTVYEQVADAIDNADIGSLRWKACMAYKLIYNDHHHNLAHYFRNIYTILDYVDGHVEIENHQKYFEIIESKFSSQELQLLFYHALCFPNMKKMIHKYNLLKSLSIEDLLDANHVELYNEFSEQGTTYPSLEFKSRAVEVELYS